MKKKFLMGLVHTTQPWVFLNQLLHDIQATRFIYTQYWGLILLSCVHSVSEQSALSISGLSVRTIWDGIFYKYQN